MSLFARHRPFSGIERSLLWLAAAGAAGYAAVGPKPWHTGVAKALAANRPPSLQDSLPWGFWWAAVAVALVCGGLAWAHRWWRCAEPATLSVPRLSEPPVQMAVWVTLLAVLLAATAMHRWPRLSHSFWGDESLAVSAYVQGHYISATPERRLGPLKFKQVPWMATWFGDWETGNNHTLFTVLCRASLDKWRQWNHRARHEFSESAARLPALAGGLGLLAAVAWLGRRLGAPRAGWLGAVLLALHPWHLRYSTEARGYSLMGMFLFLALGALITALETGSWGAWMAVAGAQFLSIASCKIALYPLVALNVVVAVVLWRHPRPGQGRLRGMSRWFVANALAAALFLVLYAPAHPQAVGGAAKIQKRGQTQFSPEWLLDMASEATTGMTWRTFAPDSPVQITWTKVCQARPETGGETGRALGLTGLVVLGWALVAGAVRVVRQSRPVAWAMVALAAGAVLMSLHLRYILKFEILPWYGFFLAPPLCLLAALGVIGYTRFHWVVMVLTVGIVAAALWPMNRAMVRHPYENLRGAMEASRGNHESTVDPPKRSRVYTCWLWRSSALYDPRGNTQIRTLPMLNYAIREAERAQGELYMIIGYPELAKRITPTVYQRVTNDPSFEKVAEFPAQVPRHTLSVYRYVSKATRQARKWREYPALAMKVIPARP